MANTQSCVCATCGNAYVYIGAETLAQIRDAMAPNFKSLQPAIEINGHMMAQICPCCDAYALGVELEAGFPFMTVDGEFKTIHTPEFRHILE